MALTPIEFKRCEKALSAFLDRTRPSPKLRDQVDIGYKVKGQSIEIVEFRPDWQDKSRISETPVAKATYVRTQGVWKVYWMRRDLKWHSYEPLPETKLFETFLAAVERDEYACFFG